MPYLEDDDEDDDIIEDDEDLEDELDDDDDIDDEDEEWLTPEGTVAVLERAMAEGAGFMRNGLISIPREMCCRRCGCTDDRACPGGCAWVAPNLCSRCLS